jgi:hypothetical protein
MRRKEAQSISKNAPDDVDADNPERMVRSGTDKWEASYAATAAAITQVLAAAVASLSEIKANDRKTDA